jgi:hypothetical protein
VMDRAAERGKRKFRDGGKAERRGASFVQHSLWHRRDS